MMRSSPSTIRAACADEREYTNGAVMCCINLSRGRIEVEEPCPRPRAAPHRQRWTRRVLHRRHRRPHRRRDEEGRWHHHARGPGTLPAEVARSGGLHGPFIITTAWDAMSNVLDYGMNAGSAMSAPRMHHQHLP